MENNIFDEKPAKVADSKTTKTDTKRIIFYNP